MSIYDLRIARKKLEAINQNVGGTFTQPEEDELADVDTTHMSAYTLGEFQMAVRMRDMRQRQAKIEGGSGINQAQRIAMTNQNRKEAQQMKQSLIKLKEAARREGKLKDFSMLEQQVGKTEDMALGRNHPEESERGVKNYGTAARTSLSKLPDPSSGQPMASVASDAQFSEWLVDIKKKDKIMDEYLDQIHVGVRHLGQTAAQMRDELGEQDGLLTHIEDHVDDLSGQIQNMNTKMKEITTSVKKDNCCMYVICVILLLSIAGGIYTITRS